MPNLGAHEAARPIHAHGWTNKFMKNLNTIKSECPGCLILFFDKKTKEPPGPKTGCNQTGVLISEQTILYCRNRKIVHIEIDDLIGSKVTILGLKDKTKSEKIINYFKKSKSNYRLFKLGVRALMQHNMKVFDDPYIMPKLRKYGYEDEHQKNWDRVYSKLQKSDFIFTYNSKSLISKIIARIDKGSWSHSGIYVGNGEIFEAISKGVVKRKIDVYRNKHIHLGIYRSIDYELLTNNDIDEILDTFYVESLGLKYGFHKALILGIRTLLGLTEDKFSLTDLTPNGLIYVGNLYLVDFI